MNESTPAPAATGSRAPADQSALTGGQILTAVLMSLFVCPGLGHRYLGRNRAYIFVLILFFGSFLVLAGTVYSLAQDFFAQNQGQPVTLQTVHLLLSQATTKATTAYLAFGLMVLVYLSAPIELILRGLSTNQQS